MPSWTDLVTELETRTNAAAWLKQGLNDALHQISDLRGGRQVIFYASAFLQKPRIPPENTQITHEDINGLMSVLYGMKPDKGLTLILHTPGGVTNAAETLVSYLRTKFDKIEVIIPTVAMSAGTMIALASDQIVMGRQSQLGPIDPQFIFAGGVLSAGAIVDQFNRAHAEILKDVKAAHVWAPILQTLGPARLQEAQNALVYSERMVAQWLEQYMFKDKKSPKELAKKTARHFNATKTHLSHGRRIDREEARQHTVKIENLEDDQALQDQVLTAYHLSTLAFEKSPLTKMFTADTDRAWLKNYAPQ